MPSDDRPSVLVVDDEEDVTQAYALWLGDDYDVTTAHDGDEALDAIDDDTDVVLLDRRMPRLSGDEALDRIREAGYDARVAMVTAVDPDFDVLEMPFDTYLTKPVSREELLDTVDGLVALSNYDDAVREQFSLAEKRATLEQSKPQSELADSEAFERLEAELEAAAEAADDTLGDVDHESMKAALSGLPDEEEGTFAGAEDDTNGGAPGDAAENGADGFGST
ncbi:response regulator [Halobaculum sp. P14]|uniref:response regulator n=1 Tax=Halobaculum sp. P14 TaxID=3421638 RepID=UPI003EBF4613